jgi:hypothetical protein
MISLLHFLRRVSTSLLPWTLALAMAGCSDSAESASVGAGGLPAVGSQLFTRLSSSVTGVRFENRLAQSAEFNVFTYRNFFNGGGVAIADLTGDGLPEIVLTANSDGPRLYLNKGRFAFRDVTSRAGLTSARGAWTTGVAIADVNGDGRLDIYLGKAGPARRRCEPTSSGSTPA